MSSVRSQEPLLPSVLDRLMDDAPDVSTEPAWRVAQDLREFRLGVLRDVENLLNTRRPVSRLPDGLPELQQSILAYGLPDFTSAGVGSTEERDQLRRAVQTAIQRFEPRLREVRVAIHPPHSPHDRTFRLTVDALLMVAPQPQPIVFDTVVQPSSGTCKVEAK